MAKRTSVAKAIGPRWRHIHDGRVPPKKGITVYLMVGCPACERVTHPMRQLGRYSDLDLHYHVYDRNDREHRLPDKVTQFPTVIVDGRFQNKPADEVLQRVLAKNLLHSAAKKTEAVANGATRSISKQRSPQANRSAVKKTSTHLKTNAPTPGRRARIAVRAS
jgi:glutaredoxin